MSGNTIDRPVDVCLGENYLHGSLLFALACSVASPLRAIAVIVKIAGLMCDCRINIRKEMVEDE